jgi:hypothetical protein
MVSGFGLRFFDWCRDFVGLLGGLLFRLRDLALEAVWQGVEQATMSHDSAEKNRFRKKCQAFWKTFFQLFLRAPSGGILARVARAWSEVQTRADADAVGVGTGFTRKRGGAKKASARGSEMPMDADADSTSSVGLTRRRRVRGVRKARR